MNRAAISPTQPADYVMQIPDEKIDQIRARYYKMSRKRDARRRKSERLREQNKITMANFERDVAEKCNDAALELSNVIRVLGVGYGDEKNYQYTKAA